MKIDIIKIEQCGCEFEGEIQLYLPEYEKNLVAAYQASNEQIVKKLPEGETREVFLYMWMATLNKFSSSEKSITKVGKTYQYETLGVYKGLTRVNGEKYHLIDSEFPVIVDEEFDTTLPYKIGDYVKVVGEFLVESLEL